MSFSIIFYNNTSENNVLDKSITEAFTKTGSLRNETSILQPSIMIEGEASDFPPSVNYMYIADFGRYYYIEDVTTLRNNVIMVSGRVDVLMTYATQIRSCVAIIKRNAEDWNLYINDGSLMSYANDYVNSQNFPHGFDTNSLILTVLGSGSSWIGP